MAEFTIKSFDEKLHNIYIKGTVGEDMWETVMYKINDIKSSDNEVFEQNKMSLRSAGIEYKITKPAINIYLCTYGGSVYDMLAIYDEIKKLTREYTVNIYCVGKIMSAGTIIMLAVDLKHRFAYPNTTFMYHTLSSGTFGKCKEMEEDVTEYKRLHNVMWDIYKSSTKIPLDELDEIYKCKKDWYITAEKAKEYGIISEII